MRERVEFQQHVKRRELMAELLAIAELRAAPPSDRSVHFPLQPGERVILALSGAALLEGRDISQSMSMQQFQWATAKPPLPAFQAGNGQTLTLPTAALIPLDVGTFAVTNERLLFLGSKQTRDFAIPDLIGFVHDETAPVTCLQIRRREAATGIRYAAGTRPHVDMALRTACAMTGGTYAELIAELRRQMLVADALSLTSAGDRPAVPRTTPPRRSSEAPQPTDLRPARAGARLVARAVDGVLLYLMVAVLAGMGSFMDGPRTSGYGPMGWIGVGTGILLAVAYEPVMAYLAGATLGKRIFGLMVVETSSTEPAGPGVLLMRSVLRSAAWLTGIGFLKDIGRVLSPAASPPWHDRHMGTVVMSAR